MHKKALFGVLFVIAVLLWGVIQWAFGNLLWAWFVQYIDANWHVAEAQIGSVASYRIPVFIVCIAFIVFIIIVVMYLKIKQLYASTISVPDMKINEALDYIVNDSKAKLKQPPAAKIEDFGPLKGHLVKWLGVEHKDARAKVNEKLIAGELSAWGYRQLQGLSMIQFESYLRSIPAEYWNGSQIHFLSCLHYTDKCPQTFKIPGQPESYHFTGLMVSKEQVKKLWPRQSLWAMLGKRVTSKPRIKAALDLTPSSSQ